MKIFNAVRELGNIGSKKAISPVVSVALLIVVSVVAVVGFQVWFNNYQGQLNNQVEQGSTSGSINTYPEAVVGDELYFKNEYENLSISEVKVNGVSCTANGSFARGLQKIDISDCLAEVTEPSVQIRIVSDKGVFSKIIYVENINAGISALSSSLICNTDSDGNGFINFSCASYPMTVLTLEGHLDPDDSDSAVVPDVSCVWNNNKSNCLSNYVIDGCGADTVLDTGIGLCWDRNFDRHGTSNWATAKSDCDTLNHAGHDDWYLPSVDEFETIIDLSRPSPHIVGGNTIFNNVPNNTYWTKTTDGSSTSDAFNVYLGTGASGNFGKANSRYVACVRRN